MPCFLVPAYAQDGRRVQEEWVLQELVGHCLHCRSPLSRFGRVRLHLLESTAAVSQGLMGNNRAHGWREGKTDVSFTTDRRTCRGSERKVFPCSDVRVARVAKKDHATMIATVGKHNGDPRGLAADGGASPHSRSVQGRSWSDSNGPRLARRVLPFHPHGLVPGNSVTSRSPSAAR